MNDQNRELLGFVAATTRHGFMPHIRSIHETREAAALALAGLLKGSGAKLHEAKIYTAKLWDAGSLPDDEKGEIDYYYTVSDVQFAEGCQLVDLLLAELLK